MLRLTDRTSGVQAATLLRGPILLGLRGGRLELRGVPVRYQLLPELIPYPMGLAIPDAGISEHIRKAVGGLHMKVLLDQLLILFIPSNPRLYQYKTLLNIIEIYENKKK